MAAEESDLLNSRCGLFRWRPPIDLQRVHQALSELQQDGVKLSGDYGILVHQLRQGHPGAEIVDKFRSRDLPFGRHVLRFLVQVKNLVPGEKWGHELPSN